MRALLASVLMALALLWMSATGGRASQPSSAPQALSPWTPSERTASLLASGQHARSLLAGRPSAQRGPGFAPSPLFLAVLPQLAAPSVQRVEPLRLVSSPARFARLLAHGPRAPPV
jgi:hypothetical protein